MTYPVLVVLPLELITSTLSISFQPSKGYKILFRASTQFQYKNCYNMHNLQYVAIKNQLEHHKYMVSMLNNGYFLSNHHKIAKI
jgi:hypothetical protein